MDNRPPPTSTTPPVLAIVNTASGATWVSLHHGGGVGGAAVVGVEARREMHADAGGARLRPGGDVGPVLRGVPVDTSGLIAHAGVASLEGKIQNPAELMKKLAASERVEQVFVRHAFRYWMGRNESPGDAATLQAAHKAYRDNHGSMKSLIVSLLTSESFLYRIPNTQPKQSAEKEPTHPERKS